MVYIRWMLKIVGYVGVYISPVLIFLSMAPRPTPQTQYYARMGLSMLGVSLVLVWLGRPSKTTYEMPPKACQHCLALIPTKRMTFRQIIGMLIVWQRKEITGFLCRNCASEFFWPLTGMTVAFGWLGRSLILVPFILVENVVNYLDSLSLPLRDVADFEVDAPVTPGARKRSAAAPSAPPGPLREWTARYRVMAYHNSSGIYKLGPEGSSTQIMISHDMLKLPPELCDRFEAWIRLFEHRRKTNYEEFRSMGLTLARELKRFMGPDVYVEYRGDSPEGTLMAPEPVDV